MLIKFVLLALLGKIVRLDIGVLISKFRVTQIDVETNLQRERIVITLEKSRLIPIYLGDLRPTKPEDWAQEDGDKEDGDE